jgi:hypothetical protein
MGIVESHREFRLLKTNGKQLFTYWGNQRLHNAQRVSQLKEGGQAR